MCFTESGKSGGHAWFSAHQDGQGGFRENLLDFNLRHLHRVAPHHDFTADLLLQRVRGATGGRDAVAAQALFRFPAAHDHVDFAVDTLHHRARQTPRADQATPADES